MAQNLLGKKVALAGPRKSEEMSMIIEKLGGTPVLRPAQGTVFLDDEHLESSIEAWVKHPPDWTLLTTGMGLDAIFSKAEQMGVEDTLTAALSQSQIAARGYKTVNALRKRGLKPVVRDDDGSTSGLIRELGAYSLDGSRVLVQLHGESAPRLMAWLSDQGVQEITQVLPYRHVPPEESDLALLLSDILNQQIDAITFTSAPQIRFLVEYAEQHGKLEQMKQRLEQDIVAAAVGKVTAQAMIEEGVEPKVVPAEERMGSMMVALGKYFAEQKTV
ncbi:uroporphyrinogen-III synthase [Paenibacillus sp. PDC88]|uniref:uroporphyrinogen-III synthase n=1 Tax=Paenibacillus sp. PDC88 TaxID=1884375 RepID=UPI000895429D|nr:uroporphyrinogen-III synthase [Paenibacillus sp. PDC88]SDW86414.1 uroporphyrinogen-III synthase [Paenibacillus sp. PDC88]